MPTVSVNDSSFDQEVLKSEHPVLVDFWAEWCGPCKALAPDLEKLAEEYGGRVKVVKINIEQSLETPGAYQIQSIPTLILFKGGQAIARRIGGLPRDQLRQWVDKAIAD